jgi:DNA polymerase-3 subunit epsilon
VIVATFGPTTGWAGRRIVFEDGQIVLVGHGPILAAHVVEYDRQGHLVWPYDGMRTWVYGQCANGPTAATASAQALDRGFEGTGKARPHSGTEVAIVDVETTGFAAERCDRVVEIAVIRLSEDGAVLHEYVTLVNPQRDVGPTHIHGISARDVRDAPLFSEVAGDVARLLDGAYFVAHNASFDRRFVAAEFSRAANDVGELPGLCTMRLAGVAGLTSRRLELCCQECGVTLASHHSALSDARATAELLQALLSLCGMSVSDALSRFYGRMPRPVSCPSVAATGHTLTRQTANSLHLTPSAYVSALVRRVSEAGLGGAGDDTEYLELLDRALEDREVTREEIEDLYDTAVALGMSGEQVLGAHSRYLEALATIAWSDGVLTEAETADLAQVGALLGLDADLARDLVAMPAHAGRAVPSPACSLAGQCVCFTGQLLHQIDGVPVDRAKAERIACEAGLVVKAGVSRKTDILVCADPASLSAKARKAREYGVRIMAEEAFWRAIGR